MSRVIQAFGITDSAQIKFPVELYTINEMLRRDKPFAVIISECGIPKLRVGDAVSSSTSNTTKFVVDYD